MSSSKSSLAALTLGAIGVVYGDIGTSPLYAFRESISHVVQRNGAATSAEIIGVISLMLWSLIAVVTIKYASILLRLDNRGEGGTLSLMALVSGRTVDQPWAEPDRLLPDASNDRKSCRQ